LSLGEALSLLPTARLLGAEWFLQLLLTTISAPRSLDSLSVKDADTLCDGGLANIFSTMIEKERVERIFYMNLARFAISCESLVTAKIVCAHLAEAKSGFSSDSGIDSASTEFRQILKTYCTD
jgi:hypothetical protein